MESSARRDIEEEWEAIEFMGRQVQGLMRQEIMTKIAKSNKSVLILGETGTGKDILARTIHRLSPRRDAPLVAINCASIPHELFEAELFGFSRGAFTGAFKEKAGLLEVAQEGTVFLDEIGDLPISLQAKLLRVIDNRVYRRIGETHDRYCRAKFIFATNKELVSAVSTGSFRRDLYYRISVIQIYILPLRQRRDSIPRLAQAILERENKEQGYTKKISPEAIEKLMSYDFPGNIRELINILERAMLLSEGEWIKPEDIRFDHESYSIKDKQTLSANRLREVLEACRWNKTLAARRLGTSRRHFYRLLQKYRVDYLFI